MFPALRKQLCPALVVIMGNPVNDKTITSAHGHGRGCQDPDPSLGGVSDQGRGSGCSSTTPAMIGPVVRTICYVAAELVRLVGCVESMKPVLQSLYHRILLYPPPQHRAEAIKIMKEVVRAPDSSLFTSHLKSPNIMFIEQSIELDSGMLLLYRQNQFECCRRDAMNKN